jgi:hypothetical protein
VDSHITLEPFPGLIEMNSISSLSSHSCVCVCVFAFTLDVSGTYANCGPIIFSRKFSIFLWSEELKNSVVFSVEKIAIGKTMLFRLLSVNWVL